MSRFEGKVALGNWGAQGHRRGIAKGLAAAGASVAVNFTPPTGAARKQWSRRSPPLAAGQSWSPGYVSKSADVARLFVETKAVILASGGQRWSLLSRRSQYIGDSNEHFKQRLDREEKSNDKAVHDHRTAVV